MSDLIAVAEAKRLLAKLPHRGEIVTLPIDNAVGSFAAKAVYSEMNVPSFDNSAMDGYAVARKPGAESYQLVGEVAAGKFSQIKIQPGEAVRIFTGAALPAGADTIVPQEHITLHGNSVRFNEEEFSPGAHIRKEGGQCKSGDLILTQGSAISPGAVALLASVGLAEVAVYSPPGVSLIITGNEIREAGTTLSPGEIYNANQPALQAYLKNLGVEKINVFKVNDDQESVNQVISQALDHGDITLITGGISVGDYDFVKAGLEFNSVQQLFYKLRQRPGKPLFAGTKASKIVFALPGNPASVLSCFVNYVKPTILQFMGSSSAWNQFQLLPLSTAYSGKPRLTVFLKSYIENGKVVILTGQESFNLISFAQAGGMTEIPEEADSVEAGELVRFFPW